MECPWRGEAKRCACGCRAGRAALYRRCADRYCRGKTLCAVRAHWLESRYLVHLSPELWWAAGRACRSAWDNAASIFPYTGYIHCWHIPYTGLWLLSSFILAGTGCPERLRNLAALLLE